MQPSRKTELYWTSLLLFDGFALFSESHMVVMVVVPVALKANVALVACPTGRGAPALFFLLGS